MFVLETTCLHLYDTLHHTVLTLTQMLDKKLSLWNCRMFIPRVRDFLHEKSSSFSNRTQI
jgi:hypothetical protein